MQRLHLRELGHRMKNLISVIDAIVRFALKPAAAQALGLTLHELATNALKYGALSNATGVVSIRFQV